MEKICVIANTGKELSDTMLQRAKAFFDQHGISCMTLCDDFVDDAPYQEVLSQGVDCAVVLGGDGTVLRAAGVLAQKRIPVLGINLGTLGFLTSAECSEMETALSALLSGAYQIEERMMLQVSIDGQVFDTALNDVVITRSGFSRIISVSVRINDKPVSTYRGDGVIVSTPTGSTGYSLSAGGPVATPTAELTIITPICPHSLTARGIVLSGEDEVCLTMQEEKKTQDEEALVTVDGNRSRKLSANDRVTVKKAKQKAYFVQLEHRSFFDVLHKKLSK